MPSGLVMKRHRATPFFRCRYGACSTATQTRKAYSSVNTTSENSSIAANSV
jgi:hypothetical protein